MRKLSDEEKKIVEENIPLVYSIVLRMNVPRRFYHDAVQCGHFGLMEAVKKFDPSKGTQFSTFATWKIKGHLTKYFRNEMDGNVELISGNSIIETDYEKVELFDIIPDSFDLTSKVISGNFRDKIFDYLGKVLNKDEIDILIKKFYFELTNDEIADDYKVTHQRIQQILAGIKEKLGKDENLKKIYDNLEI